MSDFKLSVHWTGSTAADSARSGVAKAGDRQMPVGPAAEFGGGDQVWNPEELFGASLSTCHMLTFFALARKVRLDVVAYDDHITVTLETADKLTRISRVRLAPVITVAPGTDPAKTKEMFEKAHKYCFVANSIQSEVVLEPEVRVRG